MDWTVPACYRNPRGPTGPTTPSSSKGVLWVPLVPARRGATAPRTHPGHCHVVFPWDGSPIGASTGRCSIPNLSCELVTVDVQGVRRLLDPKGCEVGINTCARPNPLPGRGPPTGRAAGAARRAGRQTQAEAGAGRPAGRPDQPGRRSQPSATGRGGETVPRYSSRPKASGMSSLEPPRGRFGHTHAT